MVEVPKSIQYFCENCKAERKHRVIKGKITEGRNLRFKGVIRCSGCGATREVEFAEERPVMVHVNISFGETTKTERVEFEPDEEIVTGETIVISGRKAKVTKVEVNGRTVKRADAQNVDRLWVKDIEKVRVKLAVNERKFTKPYALLAEPDEEFYVGEILDTEDGEVVITAIKTSDKLIKRENEPAYAEEIRRIFCRRVT
ncbi:MAG: HVO_0476 family zinc finger protein [Thermoplasmata archaeon]|nr:HVO_0476 family zinc finger protein [Thermoplasmata archaeon]